MLQGVAGDDLQSMVVTPSRRHGHAEEQLAIVAPHYTLNTDRVLID